MRQLTVEEESPRTCVNRFEGGPPTVTGRRRSGHHECTRFSHATPAWLLMAWFKVDDGFWSHPKTIALSNDAVALWVRAGAWASQALTDGFVPTKAIVMFGIPAEAITELVEVGYWHPDPKRDGWTFHDWDEYQPSAEETKAKRAEISRKRSEAGKRGAEHRWQNDGKTDGKTMANANGNRIGKSMAPSRPVPSPSTSNEVDDVQAKPARYTPEFEEWWSLYPRKQGKAAAAKAYKKARKVADADALKLGAQSYALASIGEDKAFLKLPAGWLNDGRWDDEPIMATGSGALLPFQRPAAREQFCDRHQGYPITPGFGCLACGRDLEAGTAF